MELTKKKLVQVERREINKAFKEWSILVRQRDKVCQICRTDKFLNAHHIIPRENKNFRFDISNGITLCVKHHKFSLENSPHRNPFVFYLWLSKHKPEQYKYLVEMYKLAKNNGWEEWEEQE